MEIDLDETKRNLSQLLAGLKVEERHWKRQSEETDRILDQILTGLKIEEERRERERRTRQKPRIVKFGLREHEAEAWLEQEPDYRRWIFKQRLGDDNLTEPDKECALLKDLPSSAWQFSIPKKERGVLVVFLLIHHAGGNTTLILTGGPLISYSAVL